MDLFESAQDESKSQEKLQLTSFYVPFGCARLYACAMMCGAGLMMPAACSKENVPSANCKKSKEDDSFKPTET